MFKNISYLCKVRNLDFELKKIIAEFKEFYRLLEDKQDYRLVIKYNELNNKWRWMGGLDEFELISDLFLDQQDTCKQINRGNGVQVINDFRI
jgi:hypothetical protein